MKTKIIFMLSVIFAFATGLECFGQKKEPLFGNGYHTPEDMRKLLSVKSSKTKQVKNFYFFKTGENKIDPVLDNARVVKDTILKAGSYQNTQWNPVTGKVEFIPGKEFTGDVTVYENYDEYGTYHKVLLFKNKCGNVLDAEDQSLVLREEDEPYVPEDYVPEDYDNSDLTSNIVKKSTVYLIDTVHDTVVVIRSSTTIHYGGNYYYYGDGMNYTYYSRARPVFYSAWFSWGWDYYPSWRGFRQRHHCHFHHDGNHNTVNFDNGYYGSRITNTGHGDGVTGGGQGYGGSRKIGDGHYKNTNGIGRGRVGGALNKATASANTERNNRNVNAHGRPGGALNRATATASASTERDNGTSNVNSRTTGVQRNNVTSNGRNSVQNYQRSPKTEPVVRSESKPRTKLTENNIQRSQPVKGQLQRSQPSRQRNVSSTDNGGGRRQSQR